MPEIVSEIGLRIAPVRSNAKSTAQALRTMLEEWPDVPVRIASIREDGNRTVLTVAIGLGDADEVREARGTARRATAMISAIVERFADGDPALVPLDDLS